MQTERINAEFLKSVAKFSRKIDGPVRAVEYLEASGIAVVLEGSLPRTRLDAASILLAGSRAIIGMTLRYDRVDNFWFTLLHELAHLMLHLRESPGICVDDLDVDAADDAIEQEADFAASESLIPRAVWRRSRAFRERTPEAIIALGDELGIHPAIVAGRLQKETRNFYQFSQFVGRGEVRRLFNTGDARDEE